MTIPADIDEIFEDLAIHLDESTSIDKDSARSMLGEAKKLADEKLYAPWRASDVGAAPVYQDGRVHMPEAFEAAHRDLIAWGWTGLGMPEEVGGMPVPAAVNAALLEVFGIANFPLMMCPGLTKAAGRVLFDHGGERGRVYARRFVEGTATGTMCLTEPHAGTAVGDIKTRANKVDGDTYHIDGQKIWITYGEHGFDGVDVVHLVLARTRGAPGGTKGISLFAVPTRLDDGSDNGVRCLGIEHKMGLHGSPTCTMRFGGDDTPTVGYLVGNECEGMKIMFEMMIDARIGVGIQSLAALHGASVLARDYAGERVQGVAVEDVKNPEAERVTIDRHPPVERLLLRNEALRRGMRALLFQVADWADKAEADDVNAKSLAEICTPLVKGWISEYAFRGISECLQVFGGNGYLSEFPVGQYLRDVRIALIYEGTNEVQGLDLVGRQIAGRGGARAMLFFNWLTTAFSEDELEGAGDDVLQAAALGRALQDAMGQVVLGLGAKSPREAVYHVTPILEAMGVCAALAALCTKRSPQAQIFAREFVPEVRGRMEYLAG